MDEPDPIPPLDPCSVIDDEALGEAVDAYVAADPQDADRRREIDMLRSWLEVLLDRESFDVAKLAFDRIEARYDELLVGIARWAFEQGRRHPIEQEGSS